MKRKLAVTFICLILLSFSISAAEVTTYSYKIINTYPHDREAFTQGLAFKDGYLYEGTGRKGKSSLRQVELKTGKVQKIKNLPDKYFGEGITIYKGKIYQLTWKSGVGFIYDMDFNQLDKFHYEGEGWGLTNNGQQLIMSNGTSSLYFLNPSTLELEKEITVTLNNQRVNNINELEYINGRIFANVWYKDQIIIINPESGEVGALVDLTDIINPENYDYNLNVLNGIAYDNEQDRLFVTGKLWPLIFEIEMIKTSSN
jgi:glutamine cyclotransferase